MEANKKIMERTIQVAVESAKDGDYAIGAIVEKDGEIITEGKSFLKTQNDPTAHPEIVAIRQACEKLGTRYLENTVLYTTHEPCPMCASAAIWARMKGIVFGATIEDAQGKNTDKFTWRQIDIKCKDVVSAGSPKLELVEEFMRKECNELFNLSK